MPLTQPVIRPELGITVKKILTALPQTGSTTLFNVTGTVKIIQVFALVTTAMGATATNLRFRATPTGGTAANMCANAATANDAVGVMYGITGTVATAMQKATEVLVAQASPQFIRAGIIDITSDANNTGALDVWITYVPLSGNAAVTTA